jgi:hypothetical protein
MLSGFAILIHASRELEAKEKPTTHHRFKKFERNAIRQLAIIYYVATGRMPTVSRYGGKRRGPWIDFASVALERAWKITKTPTILVTEEGKAVAEAVGIIRQQL